MTDCPAMTKPRSLWAIRWRLTRLIAHLLAGLLVVSLWFPLISRHHRQRLKACWAGRLLGIMGIELRVRGAIPDHCLLVANHVSWLDIFVISAGRPSTFVAKAEIRKWPMLGWLAKEADTLFIERGSRHHAQHIAHEMATRLKAGDSLAVFPEGTTSDGRTVMPFHAALIQPAISAGRPVQALAIRYSDPTGNPTTVTAYVGEITLVQSLSMILATRGIVAELTALAPLPAALNNRRELAKAAESSIRAHLDDAR